MKKTSKPKATRKMKPEERDNEEFMMDHPYHDSGSEKDFLESASEASEANESFEEGDRTEVLEELAKNEKINDINTNWKKIDYVHQPSFDKTPREKSTIIPPEKLIHPYDIFTQFFDDDFFLFVSEQTNLYANQEKKANEDYYAQHPNARKNDFTYCTPDDIRTYLGCVLLMGVHSLPSIRDYWARDVYFTNPLSKVYGVHKFHNIHSNFHLADNTKKGDNNKLYKVQGLFRVIEKYSQLYSPSDKIVIDEGVVPFKGRLSIKQYMPYKPQKWGIKAFIIADSTNGYNLNTVFYSGKDTFTDEKSKYIGYNVVDKMMEPFYHNNNKLFIDSFYTSYDLVKDMAKNGVGVTGTFFANRRGFPKITKDLKLKKHEFVTFKEDDLVCCSWMDTVQVNVISNVYSNKTLTKTKKESSKPYTKPELIEEYSKYMKGVDLHNQMCAFYRFPHRSVKWWRVLFYQTIQMTIVNSFILYKDFGPPGKKDHKLFILEIVERFLRLRSSQVIKVKEMSQVRVNTNQHYIEKSPNKKKRCLICKKRVVYRCRECSYITDKDVTLCIFGCFENYHTRELGDA